MGSRWASFAVWLAVAGSSLVWGERLFADRQQLPRLATNGSQAASSAGDLFRLLGDDPAPEAVAPRTDPALASSLRLIGVIAAPVGVDRRAVALIQVDGKPARAFRPGDMVDAGLVLLEIHPRGASVGQRGGSAASALALANPLPVVSGTAAAAAAVPPSSSLAGRYQRPPATQPDPNANGGLDVAPNVLLNNPADMAPANSLGAAQAPQR